jgi:hypothetical protein
MQSSRRGEAIASEIWLIGYETEALFPINIVSCAIASPLLFLRLDLLHLLPQLRQHFRGRTLCVG